MFFWSLFRNIDVSLLLRQWFLMILWRDIFETLINSKANFDLFGFCVNLWITDVSLLNHWRILDESSKKHWRYSEDFVANIIDHKCFFKPNLRNIDVSLLFRRWSLMILWRDIFETLINSMETFLISVVFVVLISESVMFHCFLIDDSLMTFWRNVDDTTKILMQTVKIIEVYNVMIIRTLLFPCCLIDYSLLILWKIFDNISMISMQTFMSILFVLISDTLMFHCHFIDDSLMNIWRDIFEGLIISMEAFLIFIVFVVLTSDSFMFHCVFLEDSLMTL